MKYIHRTIAMASVGLSAAWCVAQIGEMPTQSPVTATGAWLMASLIASIGYACFEAGRESERDA